MEDASERRLLQMGDIVLCSICRHLVPGDFNDMSDKADLNDGTVEQVKAQIGAIKYNLLSDQYYCQYCYDEMMKMSNPEDIAIMKEAFVNINTMRSIDQADQSIIIQGTVLIIITFSKPKKK